MTPTQSQVYPCVEKQNLIRFKSHVFFETHEEINLYEILIIIERHRDSVICVIIIVRTIDVIFFFRCCKVAPITFLFSASILVMCNVLSNDL